MNTTSNTASVLEESELEKLSFHRIFTQQDVHPYDEIEWDKRSANLTDEKGTVIFELKDVEFPKAWSMTATNVVVSKYFHRKGKAKDQERSLKQLIDRVVKTIGEWGVKDGYFDSNEDRKTFEEELIYLLLHQYASFNSPVWFNVGIEPKPQCSACFILEIEDTMESILNLVRTEGMLFKWGSGSGINFSTLRSSEEGLSGGGIASGPVSFMRGFDAFAGVIKSGGKTRRAAKMVMLNDDHPDIMQFIKVKGEEEKKAWALIDSGYSGDFNAEGGAYDSVSYQNANHSVRVTDAFMKAVEENREWHTKAVLTGEVIQTYQAQEILKTIAENTHICGDPGIQFHTTINEWHTCPNSGQINGSNPCSEYMFLDNSACNLASINLLKFRTTDGKFDFEKYKAAVHVLITAQEILIENAAYPTETIAENSRKFRPLGLGYTNLGAFIMAQGVPYDSDPGRSWAAVITALLTGQAYKTSAQLASVKGPFQEYRINEIPMLKVIKKHSKKLADIQTQHVPTELFQTTSAIWDEAYHLGTEYGYRNAQVTVLAPTGTISFMMDCDTTGVEPDLALIKYKKLVGGGTMQIVNRTVGMALENLRYDSDTIQTIKEHILATGTIENAPGLKEKHLPIFDCALKPSSGERYISYMGHIKMMAAVQNFISGGISKTVNMPNESTVEDIFKVYLQAWRLGIKSVAIYRDGSKRTQPLVTNKQREQKVIQEFSDQVEQVIGSSIQPRRRKLPDERESITHKFSVNGHKGYITVGMFEDRQPGEIFLVMAKEGSTISGLMDAFATAISMSLQYGVPLPELVEKFIHTRFEPSGWTTHPRIRIAKSLLDYIFRWLAYKFLPKTEWRRLGLNGDDLDEVEDTNQAALPAQDSQKQIAGHTAAISMARQKASINVDAASMSDAVICPVCEGMMIRSGSCYVCMDCGENTGCG